jgi:prepilin-type N-terminal cleavage/methylation domain-containing protein
MDKVRNQYGVTLIEVLATLTILSLLIGLVYGVFINGINYSNKAKDTVSIQQEANLILTTLKELHETNSTYTVEVPIDHEALIILEEGNVINKIENPSFLYQICDPSLGVDCDTQYNSNFSKTIANTNQDTFQVRLLLINKKKPSIKYEVQTILSRL